MNIDLNAAMRCAKLMKSHHQHNGLKSPPWLVNHLDTLNALIVGSTSGTESEATQRQSEHDVLIDAQQAAEILRCSTRFVRRIHADLDGQLLAGRWTFRKRSVVDYANGRRAG